MDDEYDITKNQFLSRGLTLFAEDRLEETIETLRGMVDSTTPEGVARLISLLAHYEIKGWSFRILRYRESNEDWDPLFNLVVIEITSPLSAPPLGALQRMYDFDYDYMRMGCKGFLNLLDDILKGKF